MLVELLVSLSVHSPMNRQAAVALAEALRIPLPERERNVLIGLNMRETHCRKVRDPVLAGKGIIFGDRFFNNVTAPATSLVSPKILVPLTPRISVLFSKPRRCATEPKLMTLELDETEADILNTTVQVYPKDAIFFRTEWRPSSKIIAAANTATSTTIYDQQPDTLHTRGIILT